MFSVNDWTFSVFAGGQSNAAAAKSCFPLTCYFPLAGGFGFKTAGSLGVRVTITPSCFLLSVPDSRISLGKTDIIKDGAMVALVPHALVEP